MLKTTASLSHFIFAALLEMVAINPQDRRELEVFMSFADARNDATFDAIEKREPPEPDIRCQVTGRGAVAFELVELLDEQHVARAQGIQFDVMDTFREEFNAMSQAHQDLLRERLGDATVRVRMSQVVSVQRRRAAIPRILLELLNIDHRHEGEYALSPGLQALASLTVVRGNFNGPRFTSMHAAHYNPIPTIGLDRKLNRVYQSNAPIELLAYFDTQHAPLPAEIDGLRRIIEPRIAASVFERVWIYDARNGRVVDVIERNLVVE